MSQGAQNRASKPLTPAMARLVRTRGRGTGMIEMEPPPHQTAIRATGSQRVTNRRARDINDLFVQLAQLNDQRVDRGMWHSEVRERVPGERTMDADAVPDFRTHPVKNAWKTLESVSREDGALWDALVRKIRGNVKADGEGELKLQFTEYALFNYLRDLAHRYIAAADRTDEEDFAKVKAVLEAAVRKAGGDGSGGIDPGKGRQGIRGALQDTLSSSSAFQGRGPVATTLGRLLQSKQSGGSAVDVDEAEAVGGGLQGVFVGAEPETTDEEFTPLVEDAVLWNVMLDIITGTEIENVDQLRRKLEELDDGAPDIAGGMYKRQGIRCQDLKCGDQEDPDGWCSSQGCPDGCVDGRCARHAVRSQVTLGGLMSSWERSSKLSSQSPAAFAETDRETRRILDENNLDIAKAREIHNNVDLLAGLREYSGVLRKERSLRTGATLTAVQLRRKKTLESDLALQIAKLDAFVPFGTPSAEDFANVIGELLTLNIVMDRTNQGVGVPDVSLSFEVRPPPGPGGGAIPLLRREDQQVKVMMYQPDTKLVNLSVEKLLGMKIGRAAEGSGGGIQHSAREGRSSRGQGWATSEIDRGRAIGTIGAAVFDMGSEYILNALNKYTSTVKNALTELFRSSGMKTFVKTLAEAVWDNSIRVNDYLRKMVSVAMFFDLVPLSLAQVYCEMEYKRRPGLSPDWFKTSRELGEPSNNEFITRYVADARAAAGGSLSDEQATANERKYIKEAALAWRNRKSTNCMEEYTKLKLGERSTDRDLKKISSQVLEKARAQMKELNACGFRQSKTDVCTGNILSKKFNVRLRAGDSFVFKVLSGVTGYRGRELGAETKSDQELMPILWKVLRERDLQIVTQRLLVCRTRATDGLAKAIISRVRRAKPFGGSIRSSRESATAVSRDPAKVPMCAVLPGEVEMTVAHGVNKTIYEIEAEIEEARATKNTYLTGSAAGTSDESGELERLDQAIELAEAQLESNVFSDFQPESEERTQVFSETAPDGTINSYCLDILWLVVELASASETGQRLKNPYTGVPFPHAFIKEIRELDSPLLRARWAQIESQDNNASFVLYPTRPVIQIEGKADEILELPLIRRATSMLSRLLGGKTYPEPTCSASVVARDSSQAPDGSPAAAVDPQQSGSTQSSRKEPVTEAAARGGGGLQTWGQVQAAATAPAPVTAPAPRAAGAATGPSSSTTSNALTFGMRKNRTKPSYANVKNVCSACGTKDRVTSTIKDDKKGNIEAHTLCYDCLENMGSKM